MEEVLLLKLISSFKIQSVCNSYISICRGIFVMERHSGSSFSEGRKPEQRSGTFFSYH
jgi:hypothetical protein